MKKFVIAALACTVAAAMAVPALAAAPAQSPEPSAQNEIMPLDDASGLTRSVIEGDAVSVKDGVLTYKIDDVAADIDIADAVILDSTGKVRSADDIKKDSRVLLYMCGPDAASDITPSIVVITDGDGFVETGMFMLDQEGNLVNDKNTLALNLDETVEAAHLSNLRDGIAEDGPAPTPEDLDGKWLMVFYQDSTRSIPALTTPSLVIALNENAVITAPGPVMEQQFTIDHVTVEENAKPSFDGAVIFDIDGNVKSVSDIKPGDVLTLIQNKAKSAIEPEYVVIMDSDNAVSVAADLFMTSTTLGEYVDTQNSLALTIADDTPIVGIDGKDVEDRSLDGKYLLVFYDKVTMSIPGITNPIKVVVLADAPAEDKPAPTEAPADKPTMQVDTTDPINQGEHVYIPVRKYAEMLGYTVKWYGETLTVQLENGTLSANFKINEDMYYATNADAKALGAAPALIGDLTYVPMAFFEDVLGVTTVLPIAQ